jgi:glycosyltransferase involved in cell wall biosynthesis
VIENHASEQTKVALVIPAYNEAASLHEVATQARAVHRWVIVVDDGSTDDSAACVADMDVTLLRLNPNQGKAAALWCGIDHALQHGAAAVISMDADGQHRALDLPRLLAVWQRHPGQIVIGTRLHERSKIPRARYLANRFANFWVAWAAGTPISDSQSGFRIYPAAVLQAYRAANHKTAGFVFESEILIEAGRHGCASIAVPIPAIYGAAKRRSHFRPVMDILRITRMVAWKLLQRGLYLQGLWRSLRRAGN